MKYITTPLEDIPWVAHGFFTRQGGVSGGIYASLNCGPGSDDDAKCIRANRAKVTEALELNGLASLHQVHSATAVIIAKSCVDGNREQADAAVTITPGIGVAVLTADCVPVLFACRKEKIVAAAHAGWKGALGGVLEAAIKEMLNLGARDIEAAIGPCIGPASYEVGGDFPAPFLDRDKADVRFFRKAEKPGHMMFDLPGYVAYRLKEGGIAKIHDTRQDTLPNEAAYFSYRRSCLRGEQRYGRQISVIGIK